MKSDFNGPPDKALLSGRRWVRSVEVSNAIRGVTFTPRNTLVDSRPIYVSRAVGRGPLTPVDAGFGAPF